MSDPAARNVIEWFKNWVRPILAKTEPPAVVEEFDRLATQLEQLGANQGQLFPVCLLGQAGVGKSTLINTLIADTKIVVPSGGGTGPLTANALRVIHGDRAAFQVRYHSAKELSQTRFIIESAIRRETQTTSASTDSIEKPEAEFADLAFDSEQQRTSRTEEAIGRAKLLVAGSQSANRTLPYLADALRWVLGQSQRFQSELQPDDRARLEQIKDAVGLGANGLPKHFDSADDADFPRKLRDHACGFLAPLIVEMSIKWPSDVLKDGLELVDLPGIGILSDAYASVTTEYLRNRAKAVMLVADSRGVRREDAELLRTSGFLNRLLHASSDLAADPVAFFVAVVKIDDVAEENWLNDKAVNGKALKKKAEHFSDQVERCRADIQQRLGEFLREVWQEDSEGKREVIQSILNSLQVFPVSAPQYRLHIDADEDADRPFLPSVESTNIPALRTAIADVAKRCLAEQRRRQSEHHQRFFGQLRAKVELLSAQLEEEQQAENEVAKFRQALDAFLAPLRREFDTRRGEFRSFVRKTVPAKIEARVENSSNKAQAEIRKYLRGLGDAHWKTLQAAVRREGTFYGSRHINLPNDFALRFEEPIAEVWSREILVDIRKETRDFSNYQAEVVKQVLEWARSQGTNVSTRVLEALLEEVDQRRQQLNAVGREAVDELRNKVKTELIKVIEGPIRRRCRKFVEDGQNHGTGVTRRILDLFDSLAEDVVAAAAAPAKTLLVERFKEVEKEILAAFREHSEPLDEAAAALIRRKEKESTVQDESLRKAIAGAEENMPEQEAVAA